jgi:hypothetical protein
MRGAKLVVRHPYAILVRTAQRRLAGGHRAAVGRVGIVLAGEGLSLGARDADVVRAPQIVVAEVVGRVDADPAEAGVVRAGVAVVAVERLEDAA